MNRNGTSIPELMIVFGTGLIHPSNAMQAFTILLSEDAQIAVAPPKECPAKANLLRSIIPFSFDGKSPLFIFTIKF